MFVGEPHREQERMFVHMVALQDIAFDAIRPGAALLRRRPAVRAYFEQHELWPHWRHHTGHAIGLRYHEGPFLDSGDRTEIRPGMVFTVEPGLYAPDLGGFRHSDTVLVTDDGIEILTYYPRDLASLVIPASGDPAGSAGPRYATTTSTRSREDETMNAAVTTELKTIGHWIGGESVAGDSGRKGPVYNPATGEQTGEVAFASTEEHRPRRRLGEGRVRDWRQLVALEARRALLPHLPARRRAPRGSRATPHRRARQGALRRTSARCSAGSRSSSTSAGSRRC